LTFAWTDEQRSLQDASLRPKVFEDIRKYNRVPSKQKFTRTMDELVAVIDSDERFQGTKALYEAPLWILLQKDVTVDWCQDQFEKLLSRFSLVQIDPAKNLVLDSLCFEAGKKACFQRCLSISVDRMPVLDRISLLWLLYLQTGNSFSWEIRSLLESYLDTLLDKLYGQYLGLDNYLLFYRMSIERLLSCNLLGDTFRIQMLSKQSEWAILPINQVSSISKEDLVPKYKFVFL
jgi:hypothetical protein